MDRASTEAVYYPKSLCVVVELCDIRIVTGTSTLPLTTEVVFQWILGTKQGKVLALDFWQTENQPYKSNERHCCE